MVLAEGLRGQSRYCWTGTDKVASRAVSTLEGRVLIAFVVSIASAMRQLECKSDVSPRFPTSKFHNTPTSCTPEAIFREYFDRSAGRLSASLKRMYSKNCKNNA